jgi:hypothetical protein
VQHSHIGHQLVAAFADAVAERRFQSRDARRKFRHASGSQGGGGGRVVTEVVSKF